MADLAEIQVRIGADTAGLQRQLQQTQKDLVRFQRSLRQAAGGGAVERQLSQTTKGFQNLGRSLDRTAASLRTFGTNMSLYVTAPLVALGAASVKLAVDAEEVANKFNTVFGPAAQSVQGDLDALHKTIFLTQTEFREAAADLQGLFLAQGLTAGAAAEMSVKYIKAAGDLASFHNALPIEAVRAFRSAVVGQSEPLDRFAADVRETALQDYGLEQQLIATRDEMKGAARVTAVLGKAMQDNIKAIGDAARTADSTANSMKRLAREAKEASEALGKELVPITRDLTKQLLGVAEAFNDLTAEQRKFAITIGLIGAGLAPALLALSALGNVLSGVIALMTRFPAAARLLGGTFAALGAGIAVGAGLKVFSDWLDEQIEKIPVVGDQYREFRREFELMDAAARSAARGGQEALRQLVEQGRVAREVGAALRQAAIAAAGGREIPTLPGIDVTVTPHIDLSRFRGTLREQLARAEADVTRFGASLAAATDAIARGDDLTTEWWESTRKLVTQWEAARRQVEATRDAILAAELPAVRIEPAVTIGPPLHETALEGRRPRELRDQLDLRELREAQKKLGEELKALEDAAERLADESFRSLGRAIENTILGFGSLSENLGQALVGIGGNVGALLGRRQGIEWGKGISGVFKDAMPGIGEALGGIAGTIIGQGIADIFSKQAQPLLPIEELLQQQTRFAQRGLTDQEWLLGETIREWEKIVEFLRGQSSDLEFLPGWAQGLDLSLEDAMKALENARDKFGDLTSTTEDLNRAFTKAINIPNVFRADLSRFETLTPRGGRLTELGQLVERGGVTYTGDITISLQVDPSMDGPAVVNAVERELASRRRRGGTGVISSRGLTVR